MLKEGAHLERFPHRRRAPFVKFVEHPEALCSSSPLLAGGAGFIAVNDGPETVECGSSVVGRGIRAGGGGGEGEGPAEKVERGLVDQVGGGLLRGGAEASKRGAIGGGCGVGGLMPAEELGLDLPFRVGRERG